MTAVPGAYLNTDCLINALHGHSLDRQTLAEAVAGRRIVTSWFVRFEYLRTVVYAFVFFEHLLRTEETIEDVLVAFHAQYRSSLVKQFPAILQELRLVGSLYADPSFLTTYLQTLTRRRLMARFDALVDEYVGAEIWQTYGQTEPTLDLGELQRRLSPEEDERLVAFFQQQRPQLEAVVRYGADTNLRGHPKRGEIEQILNLCGRILEDPATVVGKLRLFASLADLLIVLDAPPGLTIYTFDRSLEILCSALSRPYQVLPSWQVKRRN
jgi:hypothetical protein